MTKKSSKIRAVIAAVLMIISMVGASLVQTSGGKVKVEEVKFDTSFGYQLSALIYRPETATEENKAPGIIAVHGMYNNKEMQDSNLVELSRRGYVVMAIDLFSHGDSDLLPAADMLPMSGLAGLQYFAALPYVDAERIGMTGHSMGGLNCDIATQMGVTETGEPLVKALFLNCCFATYTDADGNYANIYGGRDVAMLADKYDEFLFIETNSDGTVLLPKDFIRSDNAQSFLNFGADPSTAEPREADTVYTENIDGEDAIRVVYTPAYNHPWSHFSKTGAARTIEFFDAAIGAPVSIASSNQIWQWKELFNFVGLIGLAMFALNFALVLLDTKAFSALCAPAPVAARLVSKKRRTWSVTASLVVAVLGAVLYIPIVTGLKGDANGRIIFAQNSTMALGVWAAVCGLIAMLAMWLVQRANRDDGLRAAELGISTTGKRALLALGLGVIVVFCSYLWVIAADLIFKTDFRIWFTAAKTFTGRLFVISIFPNLFFLIYFAASSLMVNSFGYYSEKKASLALQMLISVLPALSIVLIQYIKLFSTGAVAFSVYGGSSAHSMILWLFPMLLFVPTAVLISRKLYQKTNDPYLPALINACIVTFMTCANTSSWA